MLLVKWCVSIKQTMQVPLIEAIREHPSLAS